MTTSIDERQAKLERFVALDALATFLANLGSSAAARRPTTVAGH